MKEESDFLSGMTLVFFFQRTPPSSSCSLQNFYEREPFKKRLLLIAILFASEKDLNLNNRLEEKQMQPTC